MKLNSGEQNEKLQNENCKFATQTHQVIKEFAARNSSCYPHHPVIILSSYVSGYNRNHLPLCIMDMRLLVACINF